MSILNWILEKDAGTIASLIGVVVPCFFFMCKIMSRKINIYKRKKEADEYIKKAEISKFEKDKSSLRDAAKDYSMAYEILSEIGSAESRKCFDNYLATLFDLAFSFNETLALQEVKRCIEPNLQNLSAYSKPEAWGKAKLILVIAYSASGEGDTENINLEVAKIHCHEALTIIEKQIYPDIWGALQNNLGIILFRLGERLLDIAMLQDSVSALNDALSVYDLMNYEEKPGIYANQGHAFLRLGELTGNADFYQRAKILYKKALKLFPLAATPQSFSSVRLGLGELYRCLGELHKDSLQLKVASRYLRMFRKAIDFQKYPVIWIQLQHNLGITLLALGRMEDDIGIIHQAYSLACDALTRISQVKVPFALAIAQHAKGNAALELAQREYSLELASIAINSYEAGLAAIEQAGNPALWQELRYGLNTARDLLSNIQKS